jgi:tRNA (guanine37-N1)-methyltransferase
MRIDVLTLFPETFDGPLRASILGRALSQGIASVQVHNIRDWATDRHQVVDDYAYGGGPGMVIKPEPLAASIEAVREMASPPGRVVLLTPQGRLLTQAVVDELVQEERLILLCGHYEGVDERIREAFVDDEVSIGDYVLSGGEYAALVVIDAVIRRLPGTLGGADSLLEESHTDGLLEYPQYTRPSEFRGMKVPDILLSGNHPAVARWRRQQRVIRTARRRPDLLDKACLTEAERRLAAEAAASPAPAPSSGPAGSQDETARDAGDHEV